LFFHDSFFFSMTIQKYFLEKPDHNWFFGAFNDWWRNLRIKYLPGLTERLNCYYWGEILPKPHFLLNIYRVVLIFFKTIIMEEDLFCQTK